MCLRGMVVGALVVALGVVSAVAPASAQTTTISDKVDDAPARFDLTRVKVSNEPAGFAIRADVRALKPAGAQIFAVNLAAVGDGYPAYYVATVRRADGSVKTTMQRTDEDGFENLSCDVVSRWRMAKSRIRVSIPRTCAEEEITMSVEVAIGAGNGSSGDPADWTRFFRVPFD